MRVDAGRAADGLLDLLGDGRGDRLVEHDRDALLLDGAIGYAKWVALGLGTLLFLFFIRRSLKRREGEALGEPVWLREITAPQPLSALEAGEMPTAVMQRRNDTRKKAEEIAAQEPAKAAQQVRAWMQEDA